jgi:hypothetical protein
VPGAACDASCCYGCGPKRKPTRWPKSKPTIALHLWYHLPSQLITPMALKGKAGIPHCPPLPSLMSAARPSYDGTRGVAHFHVAGNRASNLICMAAPGPAWYCSPTYGMRIHEACCSSLAYPITRNSITLLLEPQVDTRRYGTLLVPSTMTRVSVQRHTTQKCSPHIAHDGYATRACTSSSP